MRRRTDLSAPRGFSLVEGLVTLLVLSAVMIGLLTLLDSSNRLGKQENQVADTQAGARSGLTELTRIIRQAGIGQGSALSSLMPWVNNAPSGTTLTATTAPTTRTLREGTDAVEVRGVLLGDQYFFDKEDVTCGGKVGCTGADSSISVTIRQKTTIRGMQNYPAAGRPEVVTRTSKFYFVVATSDKQSITGPGGTSYRAPLYYVGVVTPPASVPAAGQTSYTLTMDATDPVARTMNASSELTQQLLSAFSGGAVDDIVFFVDRGAESPAGSGLYPSPFLAMANRDAATRNWNVNPIVEEVEDMQIAYGIDGADGSTPDRGVDPMVVSSTKTVVPPTGMAGDEWVFNVPGESLAPAGDAPLRYPDFLVGPAFNPNPDGTTLAVAALRSVNVGVVVKSASPDLKFSGPGALPRSADAPAIQLFDSTAKAVSSTQPYRRRVQMMAVNLRNRI